MLKPIVASIVLTVLGTTLAIRSYDDIRSDNDDGPIAPPQVLNDEEITVEQHKAALQARWRAEQEERDRQATMSRRMMLREMHREQEARRQAMIESSKRRPVNVFAAPSVYVGE